MRTGIDLHPLTGEVRGRRGPFCVDKGLTEVGQRTGSTKKMTVSFFLRHFHDPFLWGWVKIPRVSLFDPHGTLRVPDLGVTTGGPQTARLVSP